jgi:hypothetical protein
MPYYFGTRTWERHFRSATAHNTLEVEGAPLARPAGRLAWSNVRPPAKLETALTDDLWWMRGSVDYGGGIVVTRELLGLAGGGLWISDRIEGGSGRTCRWYWQYPDPAVPVAWPGSGAGIGWNLPGDHVQCFGLAPETEAGAIRFIAESGTDENPAGWNSRGYGEQAPACRATVSIVASGPVQALSFIGRPRAAGMVCTATGVAVCGDMQLPKAPADRASSGTMWTLAIDGRRVDVVSDADAAPGENWERVGRNESRVWRRVSDHV